MRTLFTLSIVIAMTCAAMCRGADEPDKAASVRLARGFAAGDECQAGTYYCAGEQICKANGTLCAPVSCEYGTAYCFAEGQCRPFNTSCGCHGNSYFCESNQKCAPVGRQCCSNGTGAYSASSDRVMRPPN